MSDLVAIEAQLRRLEALLENNPYGLSLSPVEAEDLGQPGLPDPVRLLVEWRVARALSPLRNDRVLQASEVRSIAETFDLTELVPIIEVGTSSSSGWVLVGAEVYYAVARTDPYGTMFRVGFDPPADARLSLLQWLTVVCEDHGRHRFAARSFSAPLRSDDWSILVAPPSESWIESAPIGSAILTKPKWSLCLFLRLREGWIRGMLATGRKLEDLAEQARQVVEQVELRSRRAPACWVMQTPDMLRAVNTDLEMMWAGQVPVTESPAPVYRS